MYVYLDLNVFNKIEKLSQLPDSEKPVYEMIERCINEDKIITPYSNAHINDLLRGRPNNEDYIDGHLNNLRQLSKNLCLVQYWGKPDAILHTRDMVEFYEASLENTEPNSFEELINGGHMRILRVGVMLYKFQKLPSHVKPSIEKSDLLKRIFRRTISENTMYALIEDIYEFSMSLRRDYNLHKTFKKYLIEQLQKMKSQGVTIKKFDGTALGIPAHLILDEVWDKHFEKSKTSANAIYQKIVSEFCKLNYKGVKTDDKFANLMDDALHCFYGAHCDYFVTLDDKCHYKSIQTYKKLNIEIPVLKPQEMAKILSENFYPETLSHEKITDVASENSSNL